MNKINTFHFKIGEIEKDVDILYQNKALAYSFEHEGKSYGNKVVLESKSINDISAAAFLLAQNAYDTIMAVINNKDEFKGDGNPSKTEGSEIVGGGESK